MSESFLNGRVILHAGDSRDVLKTIPDCSIDSVVTDPPYALVSIAKRFSADSAAPVKVPEGKSGAYKRASAGFMGKKWDTGETAFAADFWAECLRVLKPGGHVVAFSGTRTYHRMACAIEDAGFEIRDQLQWIFGSGFPKSHDVSKGIDKAAGAERDVIGRKLGRSATPVQDIRGGSFAGGNGRNGGIDCSAITAPATPAAQQWEGWGTALKPAQEPICLARKPLSEGTVAANVLRWGTGAINIDACRVGNDGGTSKSTSKSTTVSVGGYLNAKAGEPIDAGRWPANLLHDGSEEVLAAFPESKAGGNIGPGSPSSKTSDVYGDFKDRSNFGSHHDEDSAARFFYQAKPDIQIFEEVTITWISEAEPHQVTLLVDTGQSPGRATVVSGSWDSNGWSTFLSGNTLMDQFPKPSRCTIRTKTSSITDSKTWSYLRNLLTKEFMGDVSFETGNGGNRAANAGSEVGCLIFTLAKTVYLPGANLAASGTLLKISVNAKQREQTSEAKRFWYTSKAGADDRLGSVHPTVKPVDLMQWLCRLVTPPGGTILDPFAGTGTTAEAAFREGFNAILIEREAEYQADIRRRMALCLAGPEERKRESIKAKVGDLPFGPGSLFALPDTPPPPATTGQIQRPQEQVLRRTT